MASTSTSPQIADNNSPLEALMMRALRRYGETSPSTVDAESVLTFIDYGNWVIDQVLTHPYTRPGTRIDYYVSQTDKRAIPDHVVLSGLLFRYAADNQSQKAGMYQADFFSSLATLLLRDRFGSAPEFHLGAVDYPNAKPAEEQ